MIICFQTRIGKYIEENNLPPKLSRYTRNRIPPKSRSTYHATKVYAADFKINFTAIKECKIMLMALSKHIPEIERQSYTLYKEKSVHTLARKHANLNLSAWSLLLLQPMQNKTKNNVNPYRSLQVMHVRLRRFNSSLVK